MGNKQDRSDIALRMRPRRRGIVRLVLLAVLGLVLLGAGTAASYYVDALWFASLGFASVFWTRLSLQAATFGAFTLLTFLVVYGAFRTLKPARLDALMGATVLVNRRPVALPVARFLNLIGIGLSAIIAALTGASMTARWMTLALYWEAPRHATMLDPIFGRSLDFYLFTLPAWQLMAGWLLTLAIIGCAVAVLFVTLAGGARVLRERPIAADAPSWEEQDAGGVAGDGAVELDLSEARALLADRLRGRPTRANFRTGDMTICTLVPMRSVPHRVVCLLGLDDGLFPRPRDQDGDDLLLAEPEVGRPGCPRARTASSSWTPCWRRRNTW